MTVEEVKALLNLKGAKNDAYIGAVLPLLEEFTYDHLMVEKTVELSAQVKLMLAKAVQLYAIKDGVLSQSSGDVSINYAQIDVFAWYGKKLDEAVTGGPGRFRFVPMSGEVTRRV